MIYWIRNLVMQLLNLHMNNYTWSNVNLYIPSLWPMNDTLVLSVTPAVLSISAHSSTYCRMDGL